MSTATRRAGIDALRIVGVLAVIAGHTWDDQWAWQWLYSWHVPLFFVLSGWLLHDRRPLGIELRQRVRSLVPPTITWWFVIAGVWWLAAPFVRGPATVEVFERPALGGAYAQGIFGTFWFVSALFLAALVARIVLATGWSKVTRLLVAVGALAAVTVAGEWFALAPWTLALGPLYAGWVVLGHLARQLCDAWPSPAWVSAALGAAMVALSFWIVGALHPARLDLKFGVLGVPVLGVVLALAIALGAILVVERIRVPPAVGEWMSLLAKPSIAVVLAHPLVLHLAGDLPTWWRFSLAALLPWAIALAVMPTRISPFLVGARPAATPWRQTAKQRAAQRR